MRKPGLFLCLLVSLTVASCGQDPTFFDPDLGTRVQTVDVTTSSPSVASDGVATVTITAVVTNEILAPIANESVTFSADSGAISAVDPVLTNADGVATTMLSAGADPTNRTITVTATAGGAVGMVMVDVVGTTLSLVGPSALPNGGNGSYTATLLDSAGVGLQGQTVDLASANGNTLSAPSLTTDAAGEVQFQLTGTVIGVDTVTATSLGLVATQTVEVRDEIFVITAPLAGAQIQTNVDEPVSLTWSVGGVAQVGETITFSSTLGNLSAASAATDAGGVATVSINSAVAGPAVITAMNTAGTSAEVQVDFVAPIVKPTAQSTASKSSALLAGGTGNGATVTMATDSRVLTTGGDELSVVFSIRLADAAGNGLAGVDISSEVRTIGYLQGAWNWHEGSGTWLQSISAGPCAAGEVDVISLSPNGGAVVTDTDGRAVLALTYPASHARWLDVSLVAGAQIDGVHVSEQSRFLLPVTRDGLASSSTPPPGAFSPYGTGNVCGNMQ